jgi:DNA-binding PadR family transcriptional regulator
MEYNNNRPYKNKVKADDEQAINHILTDGGVDPSELTLFQHAALTIIAEEPRYGLAIKRELEEFYTTKVNHGRLYPNLDTLVEKGLAEKSELDKRTNEYAATEAGRRVADGLVDWFDSRRPFAGEEEATPVEIVDEWLDSGRDLSDVIEIVDDVDTVLDAHQRLGVTSIPRTRRVFDDLGLLDNAGNLLSGEDLDERLEALGRHVELTPIADGGEDE